MGCRMGAKPDGRSTGPGETAGQREAVSDFQFLCPQAMPGARSRSHAGRECGPGLSGQTPRRVSVEEGDQEAASLSVIVRPLLVVSCFVAGNAARRGRRFLPLATDNGLPYSGDSRGSTSL